jgi:ankyrin repeat protein
VELADDAGVMLLMFACMKNLKSTVRELVFRVADLETVDSEGRTALAIAAGFSSLEIVKLLVEVGSWVFTKDGFGYSVFDQALFGDRFDTAEYLLTKVLRFTVHDCDAEGNQSLHLVAANLHGASAAQWLISKGAGVDLPGQSGFSPLLLASSYGNLGVARVLVHAGAAIDSTCEDDWTSLACAARQGHLLMAQALLLWGADPSLGPVGWIPATIAKSSGHDDGVFKLLDAWRSVRTLWVVRAAGEVRGLAPRSRIVHYYPKEMCRMLGKFLV